MIILDCEQYSELWWSSRLGLPTASMMGSVVTSGRGKSLSYIKSSSWKSMVNKLVAEKLRGKPDESFESEWTKRGKEVEAEARACYGMLTGENLDEVGLCYRGENKDCAFSPDGLITNEWWGCADDKYRGGLEIKCPSPGVHVGYLLGGVLPTTYRPQVYSSLYMSNLDYWDFFSYHPDLPPFRVRTSRSDKKFQLYAKALDKYLPMFISDIREALEKLTK